MFREGIIVECIQPLYGKVLGSESYRRNYIIVPQSTRGIIKKKTDNIILVEWEVKNKTLQTILGIGIEKNFLKSVDNIK